MSRRISTNTLLRKITKQIKEVEALDPEEFDKDKYKMMIDKARIIGYLSSIASQIIDKYELENRLEIMEVKMKEMEEIEAERRLNNRRTA